jgi:hypothetical protein
MVLYLEFVGNLSKEVFLQQNAYGRKVRDPIKFIFRMKIALRLCVSARHHEIEEWKKTKRDRRQRKGM